DPMSGFFLFSKSRLGDTGQLKPLGYKIGLEILVRGQFDTIREVPIEFRDRELGTSKMNLGQQVNYLRHLRRLYLYKFKGWAEFVHFGAVGASGFVIDLCFYYLFQYFGVHHKTARALSFWPAVSWNWALNRKTTFGEREQRPKMRQWLEFVATSLLGFSINWGTYVTLTTHFHFFDEYRVVALVTGILSASVFNFAASTLFVYNDKRKH
ncbi:MAG: GtrA family protein, partial [Pseudomonadales bacterium]|nr:GtrA family protein [Pseudomonadales bacterium]